MRNFKFITIILIMKIIAASFSAYSMELKNVRCDLFTGIQYSLPSACKNEFGFVNENMDLSNFKFTGGIKIFSDCFDFRYYQKTSSIPIKDFSGMENISDFFTNFSVPCWSVKVDLSRLDGIKKDYSIKLYTGSLSFSGSASLCKSPQFYKYPSAFCDSLYPNKSLTVNLAGTSAPERAVSLAGIFSAKDTNLSIAFTPDQYFHMNFFKEFLCGDFFRNSVSLSFNAFNLPASKETGYRLTHVPFSSQWDKALSFQYYLSVPFFKSLITLGTATNPHDTVRFFSNAQGFIKYNNFSCDFGIFATDNLMLKNPVPFYTASLSENKTVLQAKIIPELTFSKNSKTLCMGLGALYDKSLKEWTASKIITESLNLKAGIKFYDKGKSFSFYAGAGFDDLNNSLIPKLNFYGRYSHKFKKVNIAATGKYVFIPDKNFPDQSQWNAGVAVYPKKGPLKSVSAGAAFERDKGIIKHTYQAGMNLVFPVKNFSLTAKINAVF